MAPRPIDRPAQTGTSRWSMLLAALLVLVSAVGIAGGESFYASYPAELAGLVGQDVYTLLVVVPVLLGAVWLARGRSTAGLLLWIGCLFYLAYTYSFLVVGGFNAMFPAYVAIVAIALYGTAGLLWSTDMQAVASRFEGRGHPRLVAGLCAGFAGFFLVLWGGLIAGAIATGESPEPVQHAVVAIDGTVMLPLLVIGAVQLWRRRPLGYVLGGLLLTKLTLTGFGLAFTTFLAGFWAGALTELDTFLLVVFGLMGIAGLGLLIPLLRSIQDHRTERPAMNGVEPAVA